MKLLVAFFLSFCFLQNASPQQIKVDTTSKPLVLINDLYTSMNSFIINVDNIKSINILKGTSATSLYGEQGKNGAILITLKEQVKLSRLKDIFDAFNFPNTDRNLRVCIDDSIVSKPELILADMNEIASIGTFTSANFSIDSNCSLNWKDEKLINITSRKRKD
jgi:TonB-dependent SusC/RagA subfamily outer membrane receptor